MFVGTMKKSAIVVTATLTLAICALVPGNPWPARAALERPAAAPSAGTVLTLADRDQTKKVLQAVRKKRWSRARRLIKKVEHPLPHKLLDWLYYIEPGNNAGFAKISGFVRANPDWPRRVSLLRQAEAAIDKSVGTSERLQWFERFPPVSGVGRFRLAEALMHAGRKSEATRLLQKTWINDNFPYRVERELYQRFRKHLTREDHEKRLDRLLWDGRRQPARRMLNRVGESWRRLGDARLALRRRGADVDGKVARVPGALKQHPGLIYERARWRRKKRLEDTARDLLLTTGVLGDGNIENRFAERVWIERSIHARKALAAGEVTNAYRLAAEHGLTEGAKYADAEWLAGWIALRYLDDHEPAYRHFLKLRDAVRFPISVSRAAYWAARAATAMGNEELARRWYTEAAHYSTTFYGQLAAQRISVPATFGLPPPIPATPADAAKFHAMELVRAARMLSELGDNRRINSFILRLYRLEETSGRAALTADLARSLGREDLGVLVTKRAAEKGMVFPEQGYPVIDLPERRNRKGALVRGPETALVLALSRQESAFNPKIVSRAGARGLMQLMPATARSVARMIRVKYSKRRLTDPDYNTTLGRAHLRDLLQDFDGSYILSLAAYNAGKHRVKKWLRDYGDPRFPDADPVDWIENIPFGETRNYVQRVLEGVQIYRHRLAGREVVLRLEQDLTRGARPDSGYVKPKPKPRGRTPV